MKKANWLAGIATVLAAQAVFAGVGSSGGGLGVVCRYADDSIKSAELLDLYEARVRYHKHLHRIDGI